MPLQQGIIHSQNTEKVNSGDGMQMSWEMRPPLLQVDDCGIDLTGTEFKNYHRTSRVCRQHMKELHVTWGGRDSRYCHQVGMLHERTSIAGTVPQFAFKASPKTLG